MAYSTIPAAKDRLITTLQARSGLAGVLIAWGLPAEPPPTRERVYVDDAVNVSRDWAGVGNFVIDEEYTLHIRVEAFQEGEVIGRDDQRTCEERMWAIVAEVEQAIVLDVTLGGVLGGPGNAKPGQLVPKCFPVDNGWIAHVVIDVDCRARIKAS